MRVYVLRRSLPFVFFFNRLMNVKVIVGIEFIPCRDLGGLVYTGESSVRLPDGLVWENLCIKVPAQLIVTEKYEDKVKIYTATLKFLTKDRLSQGDRYAFRLRLSDGKTRLIGSDERPYPVVLSQENLPDSVKDNQLNEVTVTYSSPRSIPYII